MRWLIFVGFLVGSVAVGYFYRGAFGREASIWLIVGLLGLTAVLKLVQILLRRYVTVREAQMSPEER